MFERRCLTSLGEIPRIRRWVSQIQHLGNIAGHGLGPDSLIDLNVLELGSNVAAAYAARLLGDQGADVVKLEPVGGDPLRAARPLRDGEADSPGGLFLALNLNKRSATLDLEMVEEQC